MLSTFDAHATAVCAFHYRHWACAETSYDLTAETFARLADRAPQPDPAWPHLLACAWQVTAEALTTGTIPDRRRLAHGWDLPVPDPAALRRLAIDLRRSLAATPDAEAADAHPAWRHAERMARRCCLPADLPVPEALAAIRQAVAAT